MIDNSFEGTVFLAATPTVGATGTSEQTLMTYTLPGGSLCRNGQGLRISAAFKNTGSDTVSYKLYFGSESVTSSCTTTTGGSAEIRAFRTGSKTQNVIGRGTQADTTTLAQTFTAATEDDTAGITIKLTSTATSSSANATAEYLLVEFLQNA